MPFPSGLDFRPSFSSIASVTKSCTAISWVTQCSLRRSFIVARNGGRRIGKFHHAVLYVSALQHDEVERVVLVELPWHLRALFREHVDRSLNVAGREVDEGRLHDGGVAQ